MAESPKFGREMEKQRLRLLFSDGEITEGFIISAPAHDACEGCDGFVYDLLSTNRPAKYEAMNAQVGTTFWVAFDQLEKYEILAS